MTNAELTALLPSNRTANPSASASHDDPRVIAALEKYLALCEQGPPPNRETFLADFPEIADVLGPCLEGLALVHAAAPGVSNAGPLGPGFAGGSHSDNSQGPLGLPESLGDYRLIREIGRGGMGVVFEAQQMSLSRRVAVKVLPFAAVLDPRQLQRFKNEALAAAHLDHPNIVEVHAVGCERGVHFFAMRYVEGQTLAAVIEEMRNDECGMRNDSVGNALRGPGAPGKSPIDVEPASSLRPSSLVLRPSATDTSPIAALSTLRTDRPREFYRTIAELGIQAAEALDHAHQMGIVHRDIKPSNLMVEYRMRNDECGMRNKSRPEDTPALTTDHRPLTTAHLWITDFGLAHIDSGASLTLSGDLVGTLRYMSPEQASGNAVIDQRSDIYSLGITLYEMLTLQPAFPGDDRQQLLRQLATDEPHRPCQLNPKIPRDLETILLKAIEKDPAERYANARLFGDDLKRFLVDQPIQAKRQNLIAITRKWSRRHRPLVLAIIATLAIAALSVAANIGWAVRDRSTRRLVAETTANVALDEATGLIKQSKWPQASAALSRADDVLVVEAYSGASTERADELRKDIEMGLKLEGIVFRPEASAGGQSLVSKREAFELHDTLGDELYSRAFKKYGIDVEAADPVQVANSIQDRVIKLNLARALDNWSFIRKQNNAAGWERLLAIARLADPDPLRCKLRDTRLLPSEQSKSVLRDLAKSLAGENLEPTTVGMFAPFLMECGESDAAIKILRRTQQRHPDEYRITFLLAQELKVHTPDADDAIRYYTAALSLRADSALARNHLALLLRDKGRLNEARFHAEEAVRLAPDSPLFQSGLGFVYMNMGMLDEAIACHRTAIRLKPDFGEAYRGLGVAVGMKGQIDQAIAYLKQSVSLDPLTGVAFRDLGTSYQFKNQKPEAIASYREAVRLGPGDGGSHLQLGILLGETNQLDEGITLIREAIRLEPTLARGYASLADLLRKKGELAEATASCKEAVRLDANYAYAHRVLSDILLEKGQSDEALASAKEAIRVEPNNDDGYRAAGKVLLTKAQIDEGLANYKHALQIAHSRGDSLALDESYPEAMQLLEKNHAHKDVVERFSREAKAIMEPKAAAADKESETGK